MVRLLKNEASNAKKRTKAEVDANEALYIPRYEVTDTNITVVNGSETSPSLLSSSESITPSIISKKSRSSTEKREQKDLFEELTSKYAATEDTCTEALVNAVNHVGTAMADFSIAMKTQAQVNLELIKVLQNLNNSKN